MKSTREAAARAVRGPSFDESGLRSAFLEQDQALWEIREAALGAARKIHEALDERQRKTLAELIESGPGSALLTTATAMVAAPPTADPTRPERREA